MSAWRRHLPQPEKLRDNRWLRWLGPALFHPRLWHVHRRGIALGMALGVFFGLLIPIAQIPFSAAAAVAMRANVPAAVASTLVTNPVTFGPVYYAAWRVGSAILGQPLAAGALPPSRESTVTDPAADQSWWQDLQLRVLGVGKPLLLGLAIFASGVGAATYLAVSLAWRWRVLRRRRLRLLRGPSAQRPA
jgi:hypothetical protein